MLHYFQLHDGIWSRSFLPGAHSVSRNASVPQASCFGAAAAWKCLPEAAAVRALSSGGSIKPPEEEVEVEKEVFPVRPVVLVVFSARGPHRFGVKLSCGPKILFTIAARADPLSGNPPAGTSLGARGLSETGTAR